MQITIKSMRIIREGDGSDGKRAYKWVSVMADDGSEKGTEYTTFDAGVFKLGPGSVIDIGDPETKDGKLKFKKVEKVISEVPRATAFRSKSTGTRAPAGTEIVREASPCTANKSSDFIVTVAVPALPVSLCTTTPPCNESPRVKKRGTSR